MVAQELIRQTILEKVQERGADKSICPSEVARQLGGEEWRSLMPTVRAIAASLAETGAIVITQRGKPVSLKDAKGPIRLRLG